MESGFWKKPTPWVCTIFALSMLLFLISLATWREGRRFVSRRLHPEEARIVGEAMTLWGKLPGVERLDDCRSVLRSGELRVMHSLTFVRAQERSTFGYTSEHGRILLNPRICFAQQKMRGGSSPAEADVVATLATLYHEMHHLRHGATEEAAYEAEWRLTRTGREWAEEQSEVSLAQAFTEWEEEIPSRIQLTLGNDVWQRISARNGRLTAYRGGAEPLSEASVVLKR